MMRDQKILRIVTKLQIPFVMVFGFYVLTHGELGPGGGFQAGVILGAAFILYELVFGVDARHRVLPRRVTDFLACFGVSLYVGVGTVNMLMGRAFLDYSAIAPGAPADGESWGMTLVEYGVGITVAAVMVTIFNEVAAAGGMTPDNPELNDHTYIIHRDPEGQPRVLTPARAAADPTVPDPAAGDVAPDANPETSPPAAGTDA